MILLNKAKNYIANGAMDFWQRNTTFTAIASGAYFADRFQYNKTGTMVHTLTRDTDVPTVTQSGFVFPYSALLTLTTAQAVLAAGDFCNFRQKIEGQFFAPLSGRSIVISFWVKSSITGTFPVAFDNNSNRCYVSTYTINAINTWEKKSISLTHDNSGTWVYNNGIGLGVTFGLAFGTTYNITTLNTWTTGLFYSHSSCTNGVTTNGTTFRVTGIQLEEGTEASNFERMGGFLDSELQLCQRYYEVMGARYAGGAGANTTGLVNFPFKVNKRTLPTVAVVAATGTVTTDSNFIDSTGLNFQTGTLNSGSSITVDAEL